MKYIITPCVLICGVTALLAVMLAVGIWQRHNVRGGKILALLTVSLAIWSGALTFEYAALEIADKVFWSKVSYFGIITCPVLFLLLALSYNRFDSFFTGRRIAALFVIPAVTIALALTNERHGLIWTGFTPMANGTNLMVYGHGPAFWVLGIGYSYLLMVVGTLLLVWSIFRFPSAYRYQSIFMLIGIIIPWGGHFVYVAGMSPVPGLEIAPILLIFSGFFFTWDLYRLGLLDLVPVARELLIEKMTDGMLVLDGQDRIVDFNPAARRLVESGNDVQIGSTVDRLVSSWTEISGQTVPSRGPRYRVSLADGEEVYIELDRAPLALPNKNFSGQLVVMRNVTRRFLAEQKNQRVTRQLRAQLQDIDALQANLREQALRDPLTGLFNRHYLDESLEREFAHARNFDRFVSLCMLDIDHFKQFNDRYGHMAGDSLLFFLGQTLETYTRKEDIACRFGGEEFLLVFPGVSLEMAQQRMAQLQQKFSEKPLLLEGRTCYTSFSCGIAAFPAHGNSSADVLLASDRALYRAKAEGRNRIVVAGLETILHDQPDGGI